MSHHSVTSSIHALVLVAKSRCKKQSLCKDTKTSGVAVCGSWTHRHVKTLGMTQEQIADCLGISRRTVIRHQAGERVIKLNFAQIRRLKELLEQAGMSIDDLPADIDWGGISSSQSQEEVATAMKWGWGRVCDRSLSVTGSHLGDHACWCGECDHSPRCFILSNSFILAHNLLKCSLLTKEE